MGIATNMSLIFISFLNRWTCFTIKQKHFISLSVCPLIPSVIQSFCISHVLRDL
jgi:hypothetical protein